MQLVEAHQAGDPNAMSALLTAYQRRIHAICYRMAGEAHEAADLTQEAMLRIVQGLHSYDGRAAVSTWVIRVTMNCCLSHRRKERLRRHASLDEPVGPAGEPRGAGRPATGELSGAEGVEREERRTALLRALDRLAPEERAMIVLRDLQGLDYQQIGETLEIPLGTVKSRLFRARSALRKEAERELGAGPDEEDRGSE